MEESREKSGLSRALKTFNAATIAGVAGAGLYTLAVSTFPDIVSKGQAEFVNDYMVPAFKGAGYTLAWTAAGAAFLWGAVAACAKGKELPNEIMVTEESERLRQELLDRETMLNGRNYRF